MPDAASTWDEKYRHGEGPLQPADLLVQNPHLMPEAGQALDVAMGIGRNALHLASLGFQVTGIDVSSVAVKRCRARAEERNLTIETIIADLESFRLPSCAYDLLVNFYYLDRALAQQMAGTLRPGGVLVFETFTVDQERFGWGPDRQDYLLQPGELQRLFPDLETLHYSEGVKESDRGHKAIASLIARKPGGGSGQRSARWLKAGRIPPPTASVGPTAIRGNLRGDPALTLQPVYPRVYGDPFCGKQSTSGKTVYPRACGGSSESLP